LVEFAVETGKVELQVGYPTIVDAAVLVPQIGRGAVIVVLVYAGAHVGIVDGH
jgi:hypothetical protein